MASKESRSAKNRIILADDHTIVRQGVETLLKSERDLEIIYKTSNGHKALEAIRAEEPELAVIDISMPRLNGLEATRRLKKSGSPTRVILLSMYKDEEYVRRAITAGAWGYILKEDAIDQLVRAIESVLDGKYYFSPSVLNVLVEMVKEGLEDLDRDDYEQLTSREREVLQLVAEGNSNKEIAEMLSRSVETVRTHRANVMEKLDLHSAEELRDFALSKAIIKEDDI